MKEIFLIIFVATLAFANSDWEDYKIKNNVKFEQDFDERVHYMNYWLNKIKREKHNANPTATFKMGENKFSHLSYKEFTSQYCKTILPKNKEKRFKRQTTTTKPSLNIMGNYTEANCPDSIDYTYLMQPIVEQGACGSCYAIATLAQVEAVLKIRDPSFDSVLSPQYFLDCDDVNMKCDGGWPYDALKWIRNTTGGGLNVAPTINFYPYLAADGTCSNDVTNFVPLGLKTSKQYQYLNETSLKVELANKGPLIIALWASESFEFYESGIFQDEDCYTGDCDYVNHAMVLVGYGNDPEYGDQGDYWLFKNTWGDWWGDNGYIRIVRNRGNMCNVRCYVMFAQ